MSAQQTTSYDAVIVGSGISGALIAKHSKTIDKIRPHLVLEGLYQLSNLKKLSARPRR